MKVYVYTKAEPFRAETYLGVKATKKQAENELRTLFPHMKPDGDNVYESSSDNNSVNLLFIHEEEI
jgi:hypothetical protein